LIDLNILILIINRIVYQIKKEGWSGGSSRTAKFSKDTQLRDVQIIAPKITGKVCEIRVPNGLPNTTRMSTAYFVQIKVYFS